MGSGAHSVFSDFLNTGYRASDWFGFQEGHPELKALGAVAVPYSLVE